MNLLESGAEHTFDVLVSLSVREAEYQIPQNDSMIIVNTPYAVNTSISLDGVNDSWKNCKAGGNQDTFSGWRSDILLCQFWHEK